MSADKRQGHWLLWAIYLAMSWTWCIGMFLPVLLVRDYGLLGWIVFAIPNIVGAAAMGFVIRRREVSRDLIVAHAPAMMAFSVVTCAFQIFFVLWMFARLTPMPHLAWVVVAAAIAVGMIIVDRHFWSLAVAVVVLLVSIACVVLMQRTGWLSRPEVLEHDLWQVLWFMPVSCFGFLFAPYLDLTFHGVRMRLGARDSMAAFGVGFGVIFTAVLVLSLAYATSVNLAMTFGTGSSVAWIMIYFAVQAAFTTALHWQRATEIFARRRYWGLSLVACAVAIAWAAWFASGLGTLTPDVVYRAFMGFYGLVFPAYVWICLSASPRSPPKSRTLVIFGIAVVLAAPAFWIGFVQGQTIWLLPGLAIVLVARLAVPRRETFAGK